MYKLLLVTIVVLLSACQQLQHGATQPVLSKFSKDKGDYYFTTCGGAVEDWPSCYDKASATCNGRYDVLGRVDNSRGTQRDLTFQCKK